MATRFHLVFEVPDDVADGVAELLATQKDGGYGGVELLVSDYPNKAYIEIDAAPGPPALEEITRG